MQVTYSKKAIWHEFILYNTWQKIQHNNITRKIQHKNTTQGNTTRRYNPKIQHKNIQHKKYNKHVQREVELSSQELSMMEKGPKQQSIKIWPIPCQTDDNINSQTDTTGKVLSVLKPKSPLHYPIYPIAEAKSSTPFNFLIRLKQKRWWWMNAMNNGKWILWCGNNKNEMQLKILLCSIIYGEFSQIRKYYAKGVGVA